MIKYLSLIVLRICQNMCHPLKSMLNTLLFALTVSLAQAVVPVLNNSTAKRTPFQHFFKLVNVIIYCHSDVFWLSFSFCAFVTFV